MSIVQAIALLVGECVVVAALAGNRVGARAGIVLGACGLGFPLLTESPAMVRVFLAVMCVMIALRACDLARDRHPRHMLARLIHLVAIVDTRRLEIAPRRLDGRALGRVAGASLIFVAMLAAVRYADALDGWPRLVFRWASGAVMALAAFEGTASALQVAIAASGRTGPVMHDAPYRSLSIGEFWGSRWNRIISRVLSEHVFRPLSRRSAKLALLATFMASALLHAYVIGTGLGPVAALLWAAFFMLQPVFIIVERAIGVRRYSPALARTWTIGSLLLLSPLMTEPAVRLLATSN